MHTDNGFARMGFREMEMPSIKWIAVAVIFMVTSVNWSQPKRIAKGNWGGEHINVTVNDDAASIEYDCAHGTIKGPLATDGNGNFKLEGTHSVERGGPTRRDDSTSGRPAIYTGSIKGGVMTLTVRFAEGDETIGTFTLTHGKAGKIFKCR